jgi:hypothetical protein
MTTCTTTPKKIARMSKHQSILLAHLKVMSHIFKTGQPYPIPDKK